MDGNSTTSKMSISKSNQNMECPFCNEELQTRRLFNHIQKKHWNDFADHINIDTVDTLNKHIDSGLPISLFWKIKNDFDELEDTEIWGCLACGTGLPTKSGAMGHCSKDKCREKHIVELRKMMPMIARKEKAAIAHRESNDIRNWNTQRCLAEIQLLMRRYKYMIPHVNHLAAQYTRSPYSRNEPPASINEVALIMGTVDGAEYYRWLNINYTLDSEILRMRGILWHDNVNFSDYQYDRWKAKCSHNPDGVWIPTNAIVDSPYYHAILPNL